ncbi:GNAT family N-acetyltransferase [bacterium]|nr:GNAT family N-acetyltransferase [bacterium]
MCKFKSIKFLSDTYLHYIPQIVNCYAKYAKYLQDDYANDFDFFVLFQNFWVITDYSDNFMGFVYLDNFIGNEKSNFSAEITVCFDKKAWGSFVRYSAKLFLKKCFDEFGFYKIKALIFPDNFRVKKLLTNVGFEFETTLPDATLRKGKAQNIDIYSIKRTYYYKDEVNYD